VNVKYRTKNRKTYVREFFLLIKNHSSASTISSRNLRLKATRVCIVPESGSLVLPLRKIIRVTTAIKEKKNESVRTSLNKNVTGWMDMTIRAVAASRILIRTIDRRYLRICFIGTITL
jgi:hypothetical protein